VERFATPLGEIPIDAALAERVAALPGVIVDDAPHKREHSLEIHLPFLQRILPPFSLLPLVVGRARPEVVAAVLDAVWGGPETLVVISTDLSHFHDYDEAKAKDRHTSDLIEALAYDALDGERACGTYPVSGLLALAEQRKLTVRCIDLRNSGDTAGTPDRVVGYGSYVVH
jgi:AmmeMemoRadiSam system protein B